MTKRNIDAFCSLILVMAGSVMGFNHPEIKWRSVVTDHFIIHYYDRTEPAVYAAWKVAEQAYASLSDLYDFEARGKISLALADYDDYSNGFANWTNESIMIWIIDEYFDFRGNNTWLNNVITHELAHIVTMEKKSGLQLLDWTLNLGYASPRTAVGLTEPFATNMFWPEWFAEGISQRESQRAGNDGWDSRRDMLLRDAVLFSRPLRLAEMGHFNHNVLSDELVYNQGFSFITFLENRLGREKLRELYSDGRRTILFAQHFYSYFFNHTGLSIEKLYDEWIDSVKTASRRCLPQTQTAATVMWDRGFLNVMPKVSRDRGKIGWLTNDRDDYYRTDLVIAPFGTPGKTVLIPWAKQCWDFSPDGKKVYYIKSRTPNGQGSYLNEIFMRNLVSSRETCLVKNARAYDIALAPDNSCMAWIQFRDGVFSIVKSTPDGRDPTTVIEGSIGEPFWRLSFNPSDAGKLATTRVIGGKTRLCVVDMEKRTIQTLTGADAQEESPFWADDDRIYYSADYDGIYNIYSVNPDGSDCMRHTNTSGGLFSPYVIDDSTFIGSEYRNRGFRIVTGSLLQDSSFTPPDTAALSFKPLPRPKGKVTIRSAPYEPYLLRRVWELQTGLNVVDKYGKIGDVGTPALSKKFVDSLSYMISATLVSSRSDALSKRSSWMGLQVAIQSQGISRDTAEDTSNAFIHAMIPDFPDQNPLNFAFRKNRPVSERKTFQSTSSLLSNIRTYENYRNHFSSSRPASNDSTGKPTVMPLVIPGMGWQSNEHTLSLGLNLEGVLVNAILPAIIATSGEAEWHILRDLYADFSPQLQFYLAYLLAGHFISISSLPLSLIWSHSGYINTDIAYNWRDQTQVQGTVAPSFFPIIEEISTPDGRDTVYRTGSSITLLGLCAHGFPLMKYSSLIISMVASGTWYSEPINDPLDTLRNESALYTTARFSAKYVFPVVRQINRGKRYADALYGSLIYNVQLYSNTAVSGEAMTKALTRSSYDSRHYYVEHSVGAGVTLGLTKSYAFSQMYSFSVLWNVWARRCNVNVSFGL